MSIRLFPERDVPGHVRVYNEETDSSQQSLSPHGGVCPMAKSMVDRYSAPGPRPTVEEAYKAFVAIGQVRAEGFTLRQRNDALQRNVTRLSDEVVRLNAVAAIARANKTPGNKDAAVPAVEEAYKAFVENGRYCRANKTPGNKDAVARLVKPAIILCAALGDDLVEQNYGAAKVSKEALADTLDELYAAVSG